MREVGPDGRSRFNVEDIERLASRGRPRQQLEVADIPVHSSLTAVADGACFLRGVDVVELAGTAGFESVSEWFWSGGSERPAEVEPWARNPASQSVADLVSRLPGVLPLDGLRLAAAALAPSDPLRYDLGHDVVLTTGRRLITGLADSVPGPKPGGGGLAARLWTRLGGRRSRHGARILDTALVLLLDHDLSLSTLAARFAASLEADPYAVVAVGLNALGGPLHSVAALAAEDLLAEIGRASRAADAVSSLLRGGGRLPGFGHRLYPQGDPRAQHLLNVLRQSGATAFA